MKIKDSTVKIDNLCHEIKNRLVQLDSKMEELLGTELVITSGNDGKHSKNSFHYKDKAIDIRTMNWNVTIAILSDFLSALVEIFPAELFDIVFEGDHIHIEYDTD